MLAALPAEDVAAGADSTASLDTVEETCDCPNVVDDGDTGGVAVSPVCWEVLFTTGPPCELWAASLCSEFDPGDPLSVAPVTLAVMGSTSTEDAVRDEVDGASVADKALAFAVGRAVDEDETVTWMVVVSRSPTSCTADAAAAADDHVHSSKGQ